MKIPRDLSGSSLNKFLKKMGYSHIHQQGSHMIFETAVPSHQRIAVPNHKSIRIGTLNNILGSVARHKGISKEDILSHIK